MESIAHLLQRGQGEDQEARTAAFIVASTNTALEVVAHIQPMDARATSVRNDVVTIGVSHGTIAAIIQRNAPDICDFINNKIQTTTQHQVRRLLTRQR